MKNISRFKLYDLTCAIVMTMFIRGSGGDNQKNYPPLPPLLEVKYIPDDELMLTCSAFPGTMGYTGVSVHHLDGKYTSYVTNIDSRGQPRMAHRPSKKDGGWNIVDWPDKVTLDESKGPFVKFSVKFRREPHDKEKAVCFVSSPDNYKEGEAKLYMARNYNFNSETFIFPAKRLISKPKMNVSYHAPPSIVFFGHDLNITCSGYVVNSFVWLIEKHRPMGKRLFFQSHNAHGRNGNFPRPGVKTTSGGTRYEKKGTIFTSTLTKKVEMKMKEHVVICYSKYNYTSQVDLAPFRSYSLPLNVKFLALKPEITILEDLYEEMTIMSRAFVEEGGKSISELTVGEMKSVWSHNENGTVDGELPPGVVVKSPGIWIDNDKGPFIKSIITIDKSKVTTQADVKPISLRVYVEQRPDANDTFYPEGIGPSDLQSSFDLSGHGIPMPPAKAGQDLTTAGTLHHDVTFSNVPFNVRITEDPHILASHKSEDETTSITSYVLVGIASFSAVAFLLLALVTRNEVSEKQKDPADVPPNADQESDEEEFSRDDTTDMSRAVSIVSSVTSNASSVSVSKTSYA